MSFTPTSSCNEADLLSNRYQSIRSITEELAGSLSPEDCALQSMPGASPTKWHLAHTTWFFETFLLNNLKNYQVMRPEYAYLYNSYYNLIGKQYPQAKRGLVSRPNLEEIMEYRRYVDQGMLRLLADSDSLQRVKNTVEIGLQHEQQHQELILTDIKHAFSQNPLFPAYHDGTFAAAAEIVEAACLDYEEGVYQIGHHEDGFCFDNETPRHRVFLNAFSVSDRLVNCGEYLEFILDGGYQRPELWLSLGWKTVCEQGWDAPLYWHDIDGRRREFTLSGMRELDLSSPVCHVSYFEADAFARWANSRLLTEAEWEIAAVTRPSNGGYFVDTLVPNQFAIHPRPEIHTPNGDSLMGNLWEWTSSAYTSYPGFIRADGAIGEYNSKFMCNQYVLRGGSCATSSCHIRNTYRNFFPPDARWQFSGIRLAKQ